jgi:putative sigma-54 modulation protein
MAGESMALRPIARRLLRAGRSAVRTIVRGKNLDVPDRVRDYAERKLSRLERLLDDHTDVVLELSNEAHRSASDAHIADVSLVLDGRTLNSKAVGGSYQAAIDQVVDKVERQARDHKEKPRVRSRPVEEKVLLAKIADGTSDRGHERRIVKSKRFAIEPMFEEDAISRMEELGHAFFVYVDAQSERVQILYRRQDGDFGMIEPIVAGEYTKGRGRGSERTNGRH